MSEMESSILHSKPREIQFAFHFHLVPPLLPRLVDRLNLNLTFHRREPSDELFAERVTRPCQLPAPTEVPTAMTAAVHRDSACRWAVPDS